MHKGELARSAGLLYPARLTVCLLIASRQRKDLIGPLPVDIVCLCDRFANGMYVISKRAVNHFRRCQPRWMDDGSRTGQLKAQGDLVKVPLLSEINHTTENHEPQIDPLPQFPILRPTI
jgi:hypothetical protein